MISEKSKHYRGIKVEFNAMKSEIKLTDERFGQSKKITYKGNGGHTLEQAIDYLVNNGFNVIGHAEMKNEYIIFCDNWGDSCVKLKDIK
jgi:hypothetical protein